MNQHQQEYINKITDFAQSLDYDVNTQQYLNGTRLRCSLSNTITIHIEFLHEESLAYIWGSVRTSSWDFDGELTDLHEVISIMLACFLRVCSSSISSNLVVTPHPALYIKSEIYAMNILFDQPCSAGILLNDSQFELLQKILLDVQQFLLLFVRCVGWPCDCEKCKLLPSPPLLYSKQEAQQWAKKIASALEENANEDGVQFNARFNPTWKFYRSAISKISVVHSPELAEYLTGAIQVYNPWKTLDGINGKLFLSKNTFNKISFHKLRLARKLLQRIEDAEEMAAVVPLEHHFILVGKSYLIINQHDCSKRMFEAEKEKVRKRHIQESEHLFPISTFSWNNSIDGDDFELFIYELLRRETAIT